MKDLFAKINAEIETFKTESDLHIDMDICLDIGIASWNNDKEA